MTSTDAIIIGAGAAGLFCAARLGLRGQRAIVLDHGAKPAEKVRISGGGRCNFTNLRTTAAQFLSENPHFAKSALARFTPQDFLALLAARNIAWHEKTLGQLFCDGRSAQIIDMLIDGAAAGGATTIMNAPVTAIDHRDGVFHLDTEQGRFQAPSLVLASGGLSIPKMGATGFAYDVARRFGLDVVTPRPALAPFVFAGGQQERFKALAGVACPVVASAGAGRFEEAMLFTHKGLSGPAILQISSYWRDGETIALDLGAGAVADLTAAKRATPKLSLSRALETRLPRRLVDATPTFGLTQDDDLTRRLGDFSDARLQRIAEGFGTFELKPTGTEGWRTAEVTAGGVSTRHLSSKTMECATTPGLYFIGECVDVTGWLGGYNFQWAWSSAEAAAEAIAKKAYA